MKSPLPFVCLIIGLCCLSCRSALGRMKEGTTISKTNLVEVLPYIAKFAETLDLEVPLPLDTNHVTRFSGYRPTRGYGQEVVSFYVDNRFQFAFDVENLLVTTFIDKKYAMHALWRAEDVKPLIRPSKINKAQALEMARKYLERLGYSEKKMPVLSPEVNQWKWEPPHEKSEPLPFFTIQWPWSKYSDWEYFEIEIDGCRQKITQFLTIYPRQDSPQRAEK